MPQATLNVAELDDWVRKVSESIWDRGLIVYRMGQGTQETAETKRELRVAIASEALPLFVELSRLRDTLREREKPADASERSEVQG